ncbi:MAG: coenzyme F420-0:L-glutamate ligase, partial [Gaiellaceae bacterium]
MAELRLLPLAGLPEIEPGSDLGALLGDAVERAGGLEEGDVVVVAQKVVSKAEGRIEHAPDYLEVILREARAVRRRRDDLVIAETPHGFVCASAGVDRSNASGDGWVVLLPEDPDASAARIRAALADRFGSAPAVIVSDSFG